MNEHFAGTLVSEAPNPIFSYFFLFAIKKPGDYKLVHGFCLKFLKFAVFLGKDPAPVTQKDDIQMTFFQKFVKCSFFCTESESAIKLPEFGFNHPLGVTKGQNKKFQKKNKYGTFTF